MPPVDSPGAPASRPPPCPGGSALAPIQPYDTTPPRGLRGEAPSKSNRNEAAHIYKTRTRNKRGADNRSVAEVSCVTLYRKHGLLIRERTQITPAPRSTRMLSPPPPRPQRRDHLDPRAVPQLFDFADEPEPHTIHGFGRRFSVAATSRSRTSGGICNLSRLSSSLPSWIAAWALRNTCSPHVVGSKFLCSRLGLPFASVQLLPIAVDSATRQYTPEQNL